jgi:hypothetical protein
MNPFPQDPVYFREDQTFRQPWIWALVMVLTLAAVVCFGNFKYDFQFKSRNAIWLSKNYYLNIFVMG